MDYNSKDSNERIDFSMSSLKSLFVYHSHPQPSRNTIQHSLPTTYNSKKTTIQATISFAGFEKQVTIQELEKPDLDQKNTDDEGISLIYE